MLTLSSLDYREICRSIINADPVQKSLIESKKADHLKKDNSNGVSQAGENPQVASVQGRDFDGRQEAKKKLMEEVLLQKYGKSSVEIVAEISGVKRPKWHFAR